MIAQMTIADLIADARNGSPRAVGRLLSLVEGERRDEVLASIGPQGALGTRLSASPDHPGGASRRRSRPWSAPTGSADCRVAVLAVDPSSPFSGGALLGDRIRMAAHINDPDVLIRSVASRGHVGVWPRRFPAAIRLLGAIGYDVVLLETVGVGQSEIEIAAVADPTVVILNPGAGDAVQAAKAGVLEVADIVVVNKADRDGAETDRAGPAGRNPGPDRQSCRRPRARALRTWWPLSTDHHRDRHPCPPAGARPSADPFVGANPAADPAGSRPARRGGRRRPRRSLHGGRAAAVADHSTEGLNGSLTDETCVLHVVDDGVGFNDETVARRLGEGHIGLASHRARVDAAGGVFVFLDAPVGTRICVELPLADSESTRTCLLKVDGLPGRRPRGPRGSRKPLPDRWFRQRRRRLVRSHRPSRCPRRKGPVSAHR